MSGVSLSPLPAALRSLLVFFSPVRQDNCSSASSDPEEQGCRVGVCCSHGSGRQCGRTAEHCRPAGLCAVCLVLRLEDQTEETREPELVRALSPHGATEGA